MTTLSSIILGICSSIIATLIWVFFTRLYRFDSKRNVAFLLDQMLINVGQLEQAIDFNDYEIVISQADKTIDLIYQIQKEICFFTYTAKKRKLFLTVLYHQLRILNLCKTVSLGYDDEIEKTMRCEKIRATYDRRLNEYESTLELCRSLLDSLNNRCTINNSLQFVFGNFNLEQEALYDTLTNYFIEINSFKCKTTKYDMRRTLLTYKEYEKIIKNFMLSRSKKRQNKSDV